MRNETVKRFGPDGVCGAIKQCGFEFWMFWIIKNIFGALKRVARAHILVY